MRSIDYGNDVLSSGPRSNRKPKVENVPAELDLVVEDAASGFCGAVVGCGAEAVTLEDRHGRRRLFLLAPAGFRLDGKLVTLTRPAPTAPVNGGRPTRTASGSVAVDNAPTRVAVASRIYVEGVHDAALVEKIWGDDLRVEGVVVEPLHGIDDLKALVADFRPESGRRLGVLVDHLVEGSKESRIVAGVRHPHVLVTGHPYVDIWQAVKPSVLGIPAWPTVPKGTPWKEGVCAALGVSDPQTMWRRVIRAVNDFRDLEVPLLGAVERLIDFVLDDPAQH